MNFSSKNIRVKPADVRAADPIDKLIFEKGLRIKQIMFNSTHDNMVVFLNNGHIIQLFTAYFERLNKATPAELNNWELTGNGIGVRWPNLDEDLSLKGLIRESAISAMVHRLAEKASGKELSLL